MTIHEEKIVKWEQIKICYEVWLNTLADKYRLGETIYTQTGQIFSAIVDDLKILQKHTEAITESAHFANTMLSEVCRKEETSNVGVIPEDSSETWLVEQNLDKLKPEE